MSITTEVPSHAEAAGADPFDSVDTLLLEARERLQREEGVLRGVATWLNAYKVFRRLEITTGIPDAKSHEAHFYRAVLSNLVSMGEFFLGCHCCDNGYELHTIGTTEAEIRQIMAALTHDLEIELAAVRSTVEADKKAADLLASLVA